MNAIQTDAAPQAVGPYSQAVLIDQHLFVSGQIGIDPATGAMEPTFETQARRVLSNVKAIVEAGGLSMRDVAKVSVFLQDMKDFPVLNAIYADFFSPPYPARETVQVARLPKDAMVEVSAVAVKW